MADPIIKLGFDGRGDNESTEATYMPVLSSPGTDDGIFGPVTRNRVIRYQLDRAAGEFCAFSFRLYVDGIVGPQTWFRLAPERLKRSGMARMATG
jgi:peptidoglycan hydrolase-like protein with peptidoglycan-binding domain